jgi:4-hydroxythreonine-4-phosphate dehydrogenase
VKKPLLGITLGDPAGVGPWVAFAAALDPRVRRACRPLLIGDASMVRRVHSRLSVPIHPILDPDDWWEGRLVNVLHVPHPNIGALTLGRPQKTGGEAAALAIRSAAALALQKRVAAVVTGPVSKESLKLAGVPFPGHTEMLAALSGVKNVEMLMAAGPLRTVLVTRHLPLKDVPRRLTTPAIVEAVRRVDPWLRRLTAGQRPVRWAVCGLNPHAGDRGLLGREELRVVAPAVRRLRAAGVRAEGPLPADVAWAKHAQGTFDAVASLYHDQGMIPLKTLYPNRVVNITVGLPWVRTSPGHGTAYDLAAGRRPFVRADPTATVEACLEALRLAGAGAHENVWNYR